MYQRPLHTHVGQSNRLTRNAFPECEKAGWFFLKFLFFINLLFGPLFLTRYPVESGVAGHESTPSK